MDTLPANHSLIRSSGKVHAIVRSRQPDPHLAWWGE